MRRSIGLRDYLHVSTVTVAAGADATVLMPLCCMFRVVATTVASGATLLYRGVEELETNEGGADPTDTAALDALFCDILSAARADSGWIDAQASGVRVEAVTDSVTVKVMWTSRLKPAIA